MERTVEHTIAKRAPKRKRIVHHVIPDGQTAELPDGWREEVESSLEPSVCTFSTSPFRQHEPTSSQWTPRAAPLLPFLLERAAPP